MMLEKEVHKWIFYTEDAEGNPLFSRPQEFEPLAQWVSENRLSGTFCLAVIIPDFESEVTVRIPIEQSRFVKSGTAEQPPPMANGGISSGGPAPKKTRKKRGPGRAKAKAAPGAAGANLENKST